MPRRGSAASAWPCRLCEYVVHKVYYFFHGLANASLAISTGSPLISQERGAEGTRSPDAGTTTSLIAPQEIGIRDPHDPCDAPLDVRRGRGGHPDPSRPPDRLFRHRPATQGVV